jgi:MoaA/NifB/PqqE/SkfB family radical SAM enzyme
MGFPKPWPTEWPEPEFPWEETEEDPIPDLDDDIDGDEIPLEMPEFRQKFYSVTWAVNHACNLRCTHCYDVVKYRRHDLSTEQALNVIDRLHEAGVTFIAFSGGEAFLRKDIFELMGRCRDLGMSFGARSNGTRISQEVAAKLKKLGISVVGVSFDGATPETHDAVRGEGAFQAALAGLEALLAHDIRAQMEVVLSQQNAHEALQFIELGEAVGASEVNFSTMAPQGRALLQPHNLLDAKLWRKLIHKLSRASGLAKMPVTPNCAFWGPCYANIEPHITCDAWMTPCYLSHLKMFNVLEMPPASIRDYLQDTRMKYQDVCGRKQWIQPATIETVMA